MSAPYELSVCWIRRDIRLRDHRALFEALRCSKKVLIVFIFDHNIINKLCIHQKNSSPTIDRRLYFIAQGLDEVDEQLEKYQSQIDVYYGTPEESMQRILNKYHPDALFFNRDYEPYAKRRDQQIINLWKKDNKKVHNFKDHVIFEPHEVLKSDKSPYLVFTPYKNKWLEIFEKSYDTEDFPHYKFSPGKKLLEKNKLSNKREKKITEWICQKTQMKPLLPPFHGGEKQADKKLKTFSRNFINDYQVKRDFPALNATSNLSAYIRHGMISIRDLVKTAINTKNKALESNQSGIGPETWLSELIWREFYQMILDHFPHVEEQSFKPHYDKIKWENNSEHFERWCIGQTGYPLIDASMRCLNQTGLMHNRLRMVVASFLCKTLLIDWKKGENYFAKHLFDYDMASNNGGWQWASSSGCDAQPYFRIFNPYTQSQKFDANGEFIKQYCPELANFSKKTIHNPSLSDMFEQEEAKCVLGVDYPHPIVDYKKRRDEALAMYEVTKNK